MKAIDKESDKPMRDFIRRNPAQEMQRVISSIENTLEQKLPPEGVLKPEYLVTMKVLEGKIDPYKMFPYKASGRKYEVNLRWSETFLKYYKECLQETAHEVLKNSGADPKAIQFMTSSKMMGGSHNLPIMSVVRKEETAQFYLRTIASMLYPYLELDNTPSKHDWGPASLMFKKKWFEGFVKDPNIVKQKDDVLLKFVADYLPFRFTANSLKTYIRSRGKMSYEDFLALEEKEIMEDYYDVEFKYMCFLYGATIENYEKECKLGAQPKEKLDEVLTSLKTQIAAYTFDFLDKLKANCPTSSPFEVSVVSFLDTFIRNLYLEDKVDLEPLIEKVSSEGLAIATMPELDAELDKLRERYEYLFTFLKYDKDLSDRMVDTLNKVNDELLSRATKEVLEAYSGEETLVEETHVELPTPVKEEEESIMQQPTQPNPPSYFTTSNGVQIGLAPKSSGSVTINKTQVLGRTFAPSDLTVTLKSLDCIVLARP